MIDTIALTIPRNKYIIMGHDKFTPSTCGFFSPPFYNLGARSNFSCKQNPSKSELKKGIYKPRLTITKRIRKGGFEIPIRIEFSIPKLLFGNNFDEVLEEDFEEVTKILKNKLKDMGILIREYDLINASVSAIHYSKNIALTGYSTCSMIINELSKINLTKMLDLSKTTFRNEGQVLHYHCNSYDIAIYDKTKDLEQSKISEKRSIEEDNLIQLNLFDSIKITKPFEILRIEIRLNNKNKIKRVLKKNSIDTELIFKNLFNQNIAKQIIMYFWKEIKNNANMLSVDIRKPSELLKTIIKENPKIKNSKALKFLSIIILAQEIGIRNLRNLLIFNGKNNRFWYRLLKELKLLNLPTEKKYNTIIEVDNLISNFKPLGLRYYQVNNI